MHGESSEQKDLDGKEWLTGDEIVPLPRRPPLRMPPPAETRCARHWLGVKYECFKFDVDTLTLSFPLPVDQNALVGPNTCSRSHSIHLLAMKVENSMSGMVFWRSAWAKCFGAFSLV